MRMPRRLVPLRARRFAWPALAGGVGVALVLVVAATTTLFEPAADAAASYAAGYDAGLAVGGAPQEEELAARTAAAFQRGQDFQVAPPSDRLAAALLAMHAVLSAVARGGPFDRGFTSGWADGVAGRPSRFSE